MRRLRVWERSRGVIAIVFVALALGSAGALLDATITATPASAATREDYAVGWALQAIGQTSTGGDLGDSDHAWNWWCDNFVAHAYGRSNSGYNTAIDHWWGNAAERHPGDPNVPLGGLAFFDASEANGGAGHVMISVGNGEFVSTNPSVVRTTISSHWGTYLGWKWADPAPAWPGRTDVAPYVANRLPDVVITQLSSTRAGHVGVLGWASDPDDPTAWLKVDVYVDDAFVTRTEVRESRWMGFWTDIDGLTPGSHSVKVAAIDSSGNGWRLSDTKWVTVGGPIGYIDEARAIPNGGIHVRGWAADLASPSTARTVRVYAGGKWKDVVANLPRPGLGIGNDQHGFEADLYFQPGLPSGNHWVEVTTTPVSGGGYVHLHGSRSLAFTANQVPDMYVDLAEYRPADGTVRAKGWAVDWDTKSAKLKIEVHVDGGPALDLGLAQNYHDQGLADLFGDAWHGFDVLIPNAKVPALVPGTHKLTFCAIDANGVNWVCPPRWADLSVVVPTNASSVSSSSSMSSSSAVVSSSRSSSSRVSSSSSSSLFSSSSSSSRSSSVSSSQSASVSASKSRSMSTTSNASSSLSASVSASKSRSMSTTSNASSSLSASVSASKSRSMSATTTLNTSASSSLSASVSSSSLASSKSRSSSSSSSLVFASSSSSSSSGSSSRLVSSSASRSRSLASTTTTTTTTTSAPPVAAGVVQANGYTLTIRATPTTAAANIGSIPDQTTIGLACWVRGAAVAGQWGTTDLWHKTTFGAVTGYVSDGWVETGTNGPVAGEPQCA